MPGPAPGGASRQAASLRRRPDRQADGPRTRGERKDGSELPIELWPHAILLGSRLYTLAVVADITERLRTDASVRHLANVVESSSDTIILLGSASLRNGMKGRESSLVTTPREMIGQHVSRSLAPEQKARSYHPAGE